MCLLKDAVYVNFISIVLMKWRLWLVLSLVSYTIHLIATEKLTKMCSTLRGLLSPQFCIFSWTELLKHVREQAALRGSCISRASSAVMCKSDCRSDVQSLFVTLSVPLQGWYFQDEKEDSEDYWLTVSGNTVGRCQHRQNRLTHLDICQVPPKCQLLFWVWRWHSWQVWSCPHRKIHVAEFLQKPAVHIVWGIMTWSPRETMPRNVDLAQRASKQVGDMSPCYRISRESLTRWGIWAPGLFFYSQHDSSRQETPPISQLKCPSLTPEVKQPRSLQTTFYVHDKF